MKATIGEPLNLNLGRLALNGRQEINLGLTKDFSLDATEHWQIYLILRERADDQYTIRVEVHIEVGKRRYKKAERMAEIGLNKNQSNLLKGRIAERAKVLQSGTIRDSELEFLLHRLLDMVSQDKKIGFAR